jgi:hypothetical protein
LAAHPEAGMVYSWVDGIDENGMVLPNSTHIRGELDGSIYPDLLYIRNNMITTPSVVVPKAVLSEVGGFDPTLSICEDLDLWRRIAKKYPILLARQVLSLVRFRTQEEPDFAKLIEARTKYYEKSISEDADLKAIASKLYSEMYAHYGLDAFFGGKFRLGLGLINKSLTGNIFSDAGLLFGVIRSPLALLLKKCISPENYNKFRIFYINNIRKKIRDYL